MMVTVQVLWGTLVFLLILPFVSLMELEKLFDDRTTEQQTIEQTPCGDNTLPGVSGMEMAIREDGEPIVMVTDAGAWNPASNRAHLAALAIIANSSFAVSCSAWSNDSHPVFFPYYPDNSRLHALQGEGYTRVLGSAIAQEVAEVAKRRGVKIITHSAAPPTYWIPLLLKHLDHLGIQPLIIQAAGNSGGNLPRFLWPFNKGAQEYAGDFSVLVRYDKERRDVVFSETDEVVRDSHLRENLHVIRRAVERGQLLFTTGLGPEERSVYSFATACGFVADGCIATPFAIRIAGERPSFQGTSGGPPMVAMALASIATLHPDLTPSELGLLARACARGGSNRDPVTRSYRSVGNGIARFACVHRAEGGMKSTDELREIIAEYKASLSEESWLPTR